MFPPFLCDCVTRRLDCLRRLVVVLTEQNKIRELCHFTYKGMEKQVGRASGRGLPVGHVTTM